MRNHWLPRTRDGRLALVLFGALLVLAEPPAVYLLGNRIHPFILGMPFLYAYLLVVYFALVGVMVWALRRGL